MASGLFINIHAVLPTSQVNGPGTRLVVFFQGCARACPNCFNPGTHGFAQRTLCSPEEIFSAYLKTTPEGAPAVEGLTVSGGEPFDQPRPLAGLLEAARLRGLTTLVYTGYTYEELLTKADCLPCLSLIDVLVDGMYVDELKEPTLLARGSTNQRIHLLTDRYSEEDLVMPGKVEVVIASDGSVMETGFSKVPVQTENL